MHRFGTRRPSVACASSCSSPRLRAAPLVLAAAGALLVAACTETPTGGEAPDALASHSMTEDHTITVEVKERGKGVADVLVTVVHNVFGPFRVPGDESTVLKMVTPSSGVVTFDDLPLGGYCAHITPVSDFDDATAGGDLVVPIAAGLTGGTVSNAGAITERQGGGTKSVPFTEANYLKNCVETGDAGPNPAPIQLTDRKPSASVTLTPQPAARLRARFVDLQGSTVPASSWAVLGRTSPELNLPWFFEDFENQVRAGVHPGILMSVGGPDENDILYKGLPPGIEVAIEALSTAGGQQGLLTASDRRTTPGSGSTSGTTELAMEPLMCTLEKKTANPGTASGGALEIAPWVKDGFRATPDFQAGRAVSIWYDVSGTAQDALQMRFKDTGGATKNLVASYSCTAGVCALGSVSGSSGASVGFFARPLGNGVVRVTWIIENLPFTTNLAAVEYQLQDFPETSKDDATRAYSPIFPIPAVGLECEIDQGNDPSWWIGA